MMPKTYHEQVAIQNQHKMREIVAELPKFCADFFRGIEPTTSSRTRIAYAYDLRIFFQFLEKNNPVLKGKELRSLPVSFLDELTPLDIEEYLEYLKLYNEDSEHEKMNTERGIARKLASLRTFYQYFYKKQMIQTNPPSLVDIPKIHEKEIIRLDVDEVAKLLDEVESGESLSKSQQKYHNKTKVRDLALLTLLLGTGIRVSECVGLDLQDVDFKNNGIKILRKGGKEAIIYFSDEVADALYDYVLERNKITPKEGHEQALFLSLQKSRMSVRSVEKLVKKYALTVTTVKRITPHKLRSTYGTTLYQETGDIYLVADVLGHTDINTTRKHYAAMADARRRQAANAVTLREKK
ncbi:MAG: tyrosine-type recombinase/integrase [Agathobacter sp.]